MGFKTPVNVELAHTPHAYSKERVKFFQIDCVGEVLIFYFSETVLGKLNIIYQPIDHLGVSKSKEAINY